MFEHIVFLSVEAQPLSLAAVIPPLRHQSVHGGMRLPPAEESIALSTDQPGKDA